MDPQLLGQLPQSLRQELLGAYQKIVTNYRERKWEPSELNGGKLCEIVYSILYGYTTGTYPSKSFKPANMVDACNALAQSSSTYPRSIRILMPRAIIALYEVRNNRGVGHVGGEVDPNNMDATMVLSLSKWLLAELVRIFHSVDTQTATSVVEALTQREAQLIWEVNGKKRVLATKLSMKEKTLLLLYSEPAPIAEATLVEWLEHSNPAVYRRDVLVPGHKMRVWEYDKLSKTVIISPIGIHIVESKLLNKDK